MGQMRLEWQMLGAVRLHQHIVRQPAQRGKGQRGRSQLAPLRRRPGADNAVGLQQRRQGRFICAGVERQRRRQDPG